MMLVDKYVLARGVLDEHNAALGDSLQRAKVDVEATLDNIKMMGGTTDDALKQLRYEDIVECIVRPEEHGDRGGGGRPSWPIKPIPLAKRLAAVFRGKDEVAEPHQAYAGAPIQMVPQPVAPKVGNLTLEQLVAAYDPVDADNKVGTRLRKESKGKAFLVFRSGRTVDVVTSVKLLGELKEGFEPRSSILLGNEVFEVFPVGYIPNNFADENPIYVGRALRPDGTCDQLNRSWAGVPLEIRQFVRLLLVEFQPLSVDRAHELLDRALGSTLADLSARYSRTAIAFKKAQEQGTLPRLKVELKTGSRPFDGGVKVN